MNAVNQERCCWRKRGARLCLLAVLTISVLAGILLWGPVTRARRQATFLAEIRAKGGDVLYDYQIAWHSDDWGSYTRFEEGEDGRYAPLAFIFGVDLFHNAVLVELGRPVIHAQDIEQLQELQGLKRVHLHEFSTTDELHLLREALPACRVALFSPL